MASKSKFYGIKTTDRYRQNVHKCDNIETDDGGL